MIGKEIDIVGSVVVREGRDTARHIVNVNVIAESDDLATISFRVDDGNWEHSAVPLASVKWLLVRLVAASSPFCLLLLA